MDNRPIGVFDSGIGGLTALKQIIRIMPNEDVVYFGDTARVPYGTHTADTIRSFAKQDLEFLLSKDVKAVLIACGTVSATSLSELRLMTDIPIIGVIEPSAKIAAMNGNNILILATNATISSHAYKKAIEKENKGCIVFERACPLFVPLVENGYLNESNQITQLVVSEYLNDYHGHTIDTIVLGCTHYPLLSGFIQKEFPSAKLIDVGKEASYQLEHLLLENNINADQSRAGKISYYVSEKTESFPVVSRLFLGSDIDEDIHLYRFE